MTSDGDAIPIHTPEDEDAEEDRDSDIGETTEALEIRLQQERLDYLRTKKQRESDDAAAARKIQEEELLQIQRDQLCRVMLDEEFARRLQAEDQLQSQHQQPDANVDNEMSDSFSIEDNANGISERDFDNMLCLTTPLTPETEIVHDDENLARALQQCEQEDAVASRRCRAMQQDEYLARVIQNTQRISAMRRCEAGAQTPSNSSVSSATVQRQMSLPNSSMSDAVSPVPSGQRRHNSLSAATDSGIDMSTSPDASQTLASDTGTSTLRRRRRSRKRSCKQQ